MTPSSSTRTPRPRGSGKEPHRTIRVADDLWDAAQARAKERGESLSEVIRRGLERYVKAGERARRVTDDAATQVR